jgi:hypothetical protein
MKNILTFSMRTNYDFFKDMPKRVQSKKLDGSCNWLICIYMVKLIAWAANENDYMVSSIAPFKIIPK